MILVMHIQKSISRKVGKKEYYKYRVIVPLKIMYELDWDEDTEISLKISGKKLVVEKI
ncbi:MAG: hypothetical protein J4F36_08410 [Nitrosopumilaceae archaeon]|nr:hypothetical protein [Nitrosopumilaceae archaeon]